MVGLICFFIFAFSYLHLLKISPDECDFPRGTPLFSQPLARMSRKLFAKIIVALRPRPQVPRREPANKRQKQQKSGLICLCAARAGQADPGYNGRRNASITLCNSWQRSGVAGKSSIHLDSPQALAKLASACKTDL
jgi:hypothetical protein